jgi:hypothetical protein
MTEISLTSRKEETCSKPFLIMAMARDSARNSRLSSACHAI